MEYIIGQTYEAKLSKRILAFTILEEGKGFYKGMFLIRWNNGDEEWVYPEEMKRWVEAANEKREEEKHS